MRKIRNVHQNDDPEKYICFGCAPHNPHGLHLEFWEDGDFVLTKWQPQKHLAGWVNVLHGGIQATIMDEVAAWVVYVKCATAGVTSQMNVKYNKPVFMNHGEIIVRGTLIKQEKRIATIKTQLECDGEICSEAELEYFVYPENIARKKFYYPGVDAFFEEK